MNSIITNSYTGNKIGEQNFAEIFDNFLKEKGQAIADDTSSIYISTQSKKEKNKVLDNNILRLKKLFALQTATAEKFKVIKESNALYLEKLKRIGKIDEAQKLAKCSKRAFRIFCKKATWKYYLKDRCNLPICGFCQRTKSIRETKRSAPKFAAYLDKYNDSNNLKVVELTLTQKSKSNRSLKTSQSKLKTDFTKLRNRKIFKDSVIGGRWQLEETSSNQMWHPHLHITLLVDKNIDQKELSRTWKQITKTDEVVDIKTIDSSLESIASTIIYAFKPASSKNMTDKQLLELLETKNERKGNTFGIIFDSVFDESDSYLVEENDELSSILAEVETTKKVGAKCDCGCNSIIQSEELELDELIEKLSNAEKDFRQRIREGRGLTQNWRHH